MQENKKPTKKKNLSESSTFALPKVEDFRIGIVVSEWNDNITNNLRDGAYASLLEHGLKKEQIKICYVPGSFELPTGAMMMFDADDELDAVICLGCVIQGETRHFEFISQAVAQGIMKVALDYGSPVIFGVLTCDTMEQAMDRSGGKYGNKGVEAAVSCLKMLAMERKLR
ncbi:MAG: 6,7-dimethyl-8-ribityllumazine synthase [Bacteroidales bacterium]|nr:6,7-dimethyl-8-ribityllumazine synthase [Bacteroidales bacterium]